MTGADTRPRPLAPASVICSPGSGRRSRSDHHTSLVEQYAAMAHAFQPRPVDHLLRGLDLAIAGTAAVVGSPVALVIASR